MTKLEIAALFAGLNILLLVALSFRVANYRRTKGIGLGDGGDPVLLRRIRVQGNAAEYIPTGIAGLMFLALLDPAPGWLVEAAGFSLIAGRLLHAYGLTNAGGASFGRLAGMILTLLALAACGVGAIWAALAPVL